jgi:hypothetical protein
MKWITRERVKVDRVACPLAHQEVYRPRGGIRFLAGGHRLGEPEGRHRLRRARL